jgi:hypothetical protein
MDREYAIVSAIVALALGAMCYASYSGLGMDSTAKSLASAQSLGHGVRLGSAHLRQFAGGSAGHRVK